MRQYTEHEQAMAKMVLRFYNLTAGTANRLGSEERYDSNFNVVPGGKYRPSYGQALTYRVGKSKAKRMMKDLFGNNAISFSAIDIIESGKDYIKAEVESKR